MIRAVAGHVIIAATLLAMFAYYVLVHDTLKGNCDRGNFDACLAYACQLGNASACAERTLTRTRP